MIVRVIDITTNKRIFSESRNSNDVPSKMFLPRVGDTLYFNHGTSSEYHTDLKVVNVKLSYEWTWNIFDVTNNDIVEIYVEPITK